jgi:hypothetical protein
LALFLESGEPEGVRPGEGGGRGTRGDLQALHVPRLQTIHAHRGGGRRPSQAGLPIKNPPKNTHPKNPPKKNTKNVFFGFLNFKFFMKIIQTFLLFLMNK